MGSNETGTEINSEFPDANSPSLYLAHPTQEEKVATWTLNSVNWGSALSKEDYLARETYLMTVPLAKDGGVTHWILVDRSLPPNARPILASCESLCKPVLVSRNGIITEGITHGIGSVFSQPRYRGKGYASRMLKELGVVLKTWQTSDSIKCPFSILYSDIGKKYYTKFGWHPFPSTHIAFALPSSPSPSNAKPLASTDISPLCALDEQRLRKDLSAVRDGKTYVALLPNHDTMQWHHCREDFVTSKIFPGKPSPVIKGAISAGTEGNRIWAFWTRAYYGPPKVESGNTFHILRLVVEDEQDTEENAEKLKGIFQLALNEALDWKLNHVELWNPSEVVKKLVNKTGLQHSEVIREEESIASLMWYGEGSGGVDEIEWVQNEKYGWC